MKMPKYLYILFALLILPNVLDAQNIGVGARAGTLGFGAEAALGLSDNLTIRGGLGSSLSLDYTSEMEGVDYTVAPPTMLGSLGIDFYPFGGSFRLMGGIMYKDGDITLDSGDLSEAEGVDIGGTEYTEAGTLHGALATKSTAPFVGIGFGNHVQGGFGFFLDLGVAFVGDADVSLEAQGPIASAPGFQQSLDAEVQDLQDEAADYIKYWPILNLGIKIPIG